MAARRGADSNRLSTASANWSALPFSNTRPLTPGDTVSGKPPASDTTTGVPDAWASIEVSPNASGNVDGTTLTAASRYTSARSAST